MHLRDDPACMHFKLLFFELFVYFIILCSCMQLQELFLMHIQVNALHSFNSESIDCTSLLFKRLK